MSTAITLSTTRLLLRAVREEDFAALHEIFKDPDVMKFQGRPPHTSVEQTENWVASMMNSGQNGITDFIICLRSDIGTAIGKIGIYRARPGNEVGFSLRRDHWRKGMIKEALEAILDYLFALRNESPDSGSTVSWPSDQWTNLSSAELDSPWLYPSITANVDPRNEASIGLLIKARFVKTTDAGSQRGNKVASQYMKLNRERWVSRRGDTSMD